LEDFFCKFAVNWLLKILAHVAARLCETIISENKQLTTNYKAAGVATYLRFGGVVRNQIKKSLLLSLSVNFFLTGEYLAKLQARAWLSRAVY